MSFQPAAHVVGEKQYAVGPVDLAILEDTGNNHVVPVVSVQPILLERSLPRAVAKGYLYTLANESIIHLCPSTDRSQTVLRTLARAQSGMIPALPFKVLDHGRRDDQLDSITFKDLGEVELI